MAEYSKKTFSGFDGIKLFRQSWAAEQPLAQLVFVHGYTEHSGRYKLFAEYLSSHGISVHFYDQRCFGQSGGPRAYIKRFDFLLKDLDVFLNKQIKRDIPTILMGQSMGGLVVIKYCIDFEPDIRGIITTGAALKISDEISPFLQKISGLLSWIIPYYRMVELNAEHLSRVPEVVEAYQKDLLIYHGKTYVRTGAEMMKAIRQVKAKRKSFDYPILLMHGGDDKVTDPEGSKTFFDKIASEDKGLAIYESLYHEILFEPEKDKIWDTIKDWIKHRSN